MLLKVMIIDHDLVDVVAMQGVLERKGFGVVKMTGAYGILPKIDHEKPEILLFNPQMPHFDSEAFLETLHAEPKLRDLVIIAMSYAPRDELEAFCQKHELHGYYIKSGGFERLGEFLAQFLDLS